MNDLTESVLVLTILALVIQATAFLIGRRHAGPILMVVAAADTALYVLNQGNGTGALAVVAAVYVLRRRRSRTAALRWVVPAAVLSMIVIAIVGIGEPIDPVWNAPLAVVRTAILYGLPLVVAEMLLGRRRLVEALEERAQIAEREQELVAREAVQEQRTMIARELHDIAAHHLTGIIVSVQAARALTGTDPQGQEGYLRAVHRDASSALENLRQTVGLLRVHGSSDVHPAPSLQDLPRVLDESTARGVPVHLAEEGEHGTLGPVAGVVVIRGVQEALANVAKHAPGASAEVTLRWTPRRLEVTIEDDGATGAETSFPPSGYGLLGLRERLALINGELRAEPTAGGWRTVMRVPRESTRADGSPAATAEEAEPGGRT